jgi:hypothetical protein
VEKYGLSPPRRIPFKEILSVAFNQLDSYNGVRHFVVDGLVRASEI